MVAREMNEPRNVDDFNLLSTNGSGTYEPDAARRACGASRSYDEVLSADVRSLVAKELVRGSGFSQLGHYVRTDDRFDND